MLHLFMHSGPSKDDLPIAGVTGYQSVQIKEFGNQSSAAGIITNNEIP